MSGIFFNLFHPLQWYLMSCLFFNLNKFLYVYEDFHYSLYSIDCINTWTLILDIKNQSNREVFMLIFVSLQLRAEFFGLRFKVWICDIVFMHKFRKPCYFVIRFLKNVLITQLKKKFKYSREIVWLCKVSEDACIMAFLLLKLSNNY